MKNSKLVLAAALLLFSAMNVTAQKKKSAAPSKRGPMEMPKDAEVQVMAAGEKAISYYYKTNDRLPLNTIPTIKMQTSISLTTVPKNYCIRLNWMIRV